MAAFKEASVRWIESVHSLMQTVTPGLGIVPNVCVDNAGWVHTPDAQRVAAAVTGALSERGFTGRMRFYHALRSSAFAFHVECIFVHCMCLRITRTRRAGNDAYCTYQDFSSPPLPTAVIGWGSGRIKEQELLDEYR